MSVVVAMNGNTTTRGDLPAKHDLVVDRDGLKKMDSRAGQLYLGKEIESGVTSLGVGAALLARGVLTDRYDAPVAHSVHDTEVVKVPVDTLRGNTPFSVRRRTAVPDLRAADAHLGEGPVTRVSPDFADLARTGLWVSPALLIFGERERVAESVLAGLKGGQSRFADFALVRGQADVVPVDSRHRPEARGHRRQPK